MIRTSPFKLLLYVLFAVCVARTMEASLRTLPYSNLGGNVSTLVLTNPTAHVVTFPDGTPDTWKFPNYAIAPHETKRLVAWYDAGSGHATVEIPTAILAVVELEDDRGNVMRLGETPPSTGPLQLLDLVAGNDNRSYIAAGGQIGTVQWFAGDSLIGAAVLPAMGVREFAILPAPIGANRAVVSPPPLVGVPCGQPDCPLPTVYAFAFNARQSGRFELNNPISAVAVVP